MAKKSGLFENTKIYRPEDLDPQFREKFINILSKSRGGGYWLWKHHIIENELSKVNNNDFVIYSDAGSSFNYHGVERFKEYIKEFVVRNGLRMHLLKEFDCILVRYYILNHFNVDVLFVAW